MSSIGGFLGNDSSFGKLMTKVGTIIAANIMFVVCCIPFVTVGAAQKALYYTVFSMINTEDAINPFRTFWEGFRKNFIRTTLYWIGFAGIMILGFTDLQICRQAEGEIQYFSAGIIAVMLIVMIIGLYLFPLLSVYTGNLPEMLKRAVFFSVNRPLRLAAILSVNMFPLLIYMIDEGNRPTYAFIGAFCGFGVIALITGKLLNFLIRKYPENEIDSESYNSIYNRNE